MSVSLVGLTEHLNYSSRTNTAVPGDLWKTPKRDNKESQMVRIKHTVEKASRDGYFNWKIFIDEEQRDILQKIIKVEYGLHPSFPQPNVTKENRAEKFELKGSGWAEFEVKVKIFLKGQDEPIEKYHWLTLDNSK
jgi:transcription initiation factor IIF auxiliary subunit